MSINAIFVDSSAPSGCMFVNFRSLTVDDVTAAIRLLPDKQYTSDSIPTRLLKDCADVIAPFLVELYNKSLQSGSVPALFKAAYITPLLKKSDLDSADVHSYRPISNLTVLSKLLECLVTRTVCHPASQTLGTFRRRLKTHLFAVSFT